mmetsp:Transcript_31678/g.48219  ORF Transcript_31678/g.48219 Transcript_31678/m.48219 type:complete len:315 (+) Transcript_31678:260-1204(+)
MALLWRVCCKFPIIAQWRRRCTTQLRYIVSTNNQVAKSVSRAAPAILQGLDEVGWAVVPDFIIARTPSSSQGTDDDKSFCNNNNNNNNGPVIVEPFCAAVRAEAAAFYDSGRFKTIQHTRLKSEKDGDGYWRTTGDYEIYSDRPGVYSMQLETGDSSSGFQMHLYCKDMARTLVPLINSHFCDTNHQGAIPVLQDVHQERRGGIPANRLSVCIGNGSGYDAHYDNTSDRISTREDLRKLTVILYLTPHWQVEHGGQFRIHNPPPRCSSSLLVEPEANTLLVFWSDKVLHSVLPSECPGGAANHRYALAIWLNID